MPEWYQHPQEWLAVVFVLVGFVMLIKGADFLVEGAVFLAQRFNLSKAVIGATVVAFGTSLPELVVSVGANFKAVVEGKGGDPNGPAAIAIANIVGSNIFNVGAILGLSAIFAWLPVARDTLRRDLPLMFVAFMLMVGFSWPDADGVGRIERWEAGCLVVGLIAFTLFALKTGKVDADEVDELGGKVTSMGVAILLLIGGIAMLTIGGSTCLNGAVVIASTLGLSERVIGLTVMAIGTSLPELVTSLRAARHGHAEIAIGNVVGSNIFNVLCIIGISGLILPMPVSQGTISWDYYWMWGINLLMVPFLCIWGGLNRWHGIVLLLALSTYIVLVLVLQDPGQAAVPAPDP